MSGFLATLPFCAVIVSVWSSSSSLAATVVSVTSASSASQLIVAVPLTSSPLSSAALSVTLWYVPQLDVVNESVAPPVTVMSGSPAVLPTVTVTGPVGCALNRTWNVALSPSGTDTVATSVSTSTGLVTSDSPETVMTVPGVTR